MALREESILRTPQLPEDDEDAWPTYVLEAANVWLKGHRRAEPLHHAHPDFPLIVNGVLQPVGESYKEYLKNNKGIGQRIQLNDVTKFASGTVGRGKKQKHVLWAFGKTGWFELRPSEKYRSVYDEMMQGVKLFYFMCDQYTRQAHQRRPVPRQIYKAYAAMPKSQCSDANAVEELLYRHHYFLLSEMIKDTQDIGWEKTPIFRDLADAFPEVTQNIRLRIFDSDTEDEESKNQTEDTRSSSKSSNSPEQQDEAPDQVEDGIHDATQEEPEEPKLPSETDPVPHTPRGPRQRKRARPRQSVLRPTSSRPSKSTKQRGKGLPRLNDDQDSESEDELVHRNGNHEHKNGDRDSDETSKENEENDTSDDNEIRENSGNQDISDLNHFNSARNAADVERELSINIRRDSLKMQGAGIVNQRLSVLQSERSRGARISNLMEFVMHQPAEF
ncbi:MAG: hypothetical protein Q9227_008404 [Pyrenula ochraceoflavens]